MFEGDWMLMVVLSDGFYGVFEGVISLFFVMVFGGWYLIV